MAKKETKPAKKSLDKLKSQAVDGKKVKGGISVNIGSGIGGGGGGGNGG